MNAYLDTHVAVWLHDGLVERISPFAGSLIEEADLLLSPAALLELQYLYDRKRISRKPLPVLTYLTLTFGIRLCELPFPAVVVEALNLAWTNDPFDRLIVAQAKANHDAKLITADANIRQHYSGAVW